MAEKTISQIPRPLRENFEKGKTAYDRRNYDYAIAIFTSILEREPAFYDCREALRASQFKKCGGSTTLFRKMLSGAGSSPLLAKGQIMLLKEPKEALKIAEQILNSDPNSAAGHKLLGEAAMACDLPKTAILSLEIATKNAPKDEEIKKDLARAFSAAGQGDKAEAIFVELMRLHPGDLRLVQELKDISAKKTLSEGGYDALAGGTGSYRDILKDKDRAVAMEQEGRQIKSEDVATRMIAEKEQLLAKDPKNKQLLLSLAELYLGQNNFDKTLETYQRVIEAEGNADISLQRLISEATHKRFNYAISQVDANDPAGAEKIKQLEGERNIYLLAEGEKRAERYPNDLVIRFDLGKLYFQAGKITEAIREFQKAQNNPNKRIQSLSYLGQCFAARNMNDMAVRALQSALKEKLVFDEEKKEMIYALGGIFEKMGQKEQSIEQYKTIYEFDSSYKDVAKKVEDYYSGQG